MLTMVNIHKLKLTQLQQEILRILFIKAGKSFNQRQLANFLEVSAPAVMKALPNLKKFVKTEQDSETKRWAIQLNRDKKEIIQLKRVDNLRQIYESGLNNFLEETFPGATIVLFGSYSRGEDIFNSDLDIAVIGRKEKKVNLENYQKLLEKNITLNFYPSLKEVHQHLKENICNGILLSGGVEL